MFPCSPKPHNACMHEVAGRLETIRIRLTRGVTWLLGTFRICLEWHRVAVIQRSDVKTRL